MKKIIIFIFLGFILSGCATYKFQKPTTSGAQGYLVSYDGKPLLEYTVGKEKSLPDLTLAKERFKRRRSTVEYYYKQMDFIEPRLKTYFWDTPTMLLDLVGGIFRWPFTASSDYKYNHDPKYKEKMDKLDEQKEDLEKARVSSLKTKLAAYIVEDLNKEAPSSNVVVVAPAEAKIETVQVPPAIAVESPSTPEIAPKVEAPVIQEIVTPAAKIVPVTTSVVEPAVAPIVPLPKKTKPLIIKPVVVKRVVEPPVAVIIARPAKGSSPLKVNFSGQKSYSKSAKIIAYDWDFGDGDTSSKKNPENTYWSTTFGSRNFIVTLSVRDDAGNTSVANSVIEVIAQ